MKEGIKNTMFFVGASAACTAAAAGIVANMSKEKGRAPDKYHFCSAGIIPMWDDKKNHVIDKNVGYFYPSFSGGVQGKSFTEEQKPSVRNRV